MNKPRKTLYLFRHGETFSNVEGIFQGSTEPLTPKGREQAAQLAARLSSQHNRYPITLLLSSNYARALETASPIAHALGLDICPTPLFVERKHPQVIHGKSTSDPDARAIWIRGRENFHNRKFDYADGETFARLKARALLALKFVLNCSDEHIGVVTHGVFATALAAASQRGAKLTSHDLNCYQFRLDNTGFSILTNQTHKDFSHNVTGWIIQKWNDTSHLN